jgi:SAM-dependent methyltransferase
MKLKSALEIKKYPIKIERLWKRYIESGKAAQCQCGWSGKSFMRGGTDNRKGAECPSCYSKERHRTYYSLLETLPPAFFSRVLHLSPSRLIRKFLEEISEEYIPTNLCPENGEQKEDIRELSFPEGYFDFIFCSHVLEHVVEEKRALSELRRVLTPGGIAIIQVPIKRRITLELTSALNERERERIYGQRDHVRIYGEDFPYILENAGFSVERNDFAFKIPEETIKRFGMKRETIHLCRK